MTFSTKRKPLIYPPLYLDNIQLQLTNVHSHLGMTLSTNLSWSRHINLAVLRASKRVNILKRLKFSMGRNSLIHIYQTMIRPILEYGCIIYDNCTSGEAELLESVQLDAARVCTGALWNTSKHKLLEELGWATLSIRRKFFKLCTLFKIHHDLLPEYLSHGHLILAGDISRYPLRNSKNWRVPFARTNKYKLSFYPSAISAYNDLSKEFSDIDNLYKFKKTLSATLFPASVPPYFNSGHRFASIYHTQLRLGHSHLCSHTFKHWLGESDTCSCGQHDTTEHFFFHCPNYVALRPPFLASVARLISPGINYNLLLAIDKTHLLNVLLKGSAELSTEDNKTLFLAVQDFISNTCHFNHLLCNY